MVNILIHHSEIVLKGKNRSFFENRLQGNIEKAFHRNNLKVLSIKKEHSKIFCEVDNEINNIKKDIKEQIIDVLKKVPGIKYFTFVEVIEPDISKLVEKAEEIIKKIDAKRIGVTTKRSDKSFPMSSIEISKEIGAVIDKLGKKVDLTNPEFTLNINVGTKMFISTKRYEGVPGLPVGSSGKVLCLLSGGIDSPAAAYKIMSRGCQVDFIHFHALKENSDVLKTKIKKIAETMDQFQGKTKLFIVPYSIYQLKTLGIPQDMDLVMFKNFMLRVAQKVAFRNNYKALVTGDSLGQVASQTLDNIHSTSVGIELPILRPLIGMDKEEIVKIALFIDTYEDSIKEYKDCCSIVSKKPNTKVKAEEVVNTFKNCKINDVIQETIYAIDLVNID